MSPEIRTLVDDMVARLHRQGATEFEEIIAWRSLVLTHKEASAHPACVEFAKRYGRIVGTISDMGLHYGVLSYP